MITGEGKRKVLKENRRGTIETRGKLVIKTRRCKENCDEDRRKEKKDEGERGRKGAKRSLLKAESFLDS